MRLIDADAAVESLTEYGNGRAVYISVEEAVRRIEQLPSAEPYTTTHDSIPAETGKNDGDRTSGDCISRQAAIDALKEKVFHNLSDEFYGAMQVLDELPSAQPEPRTAYWTKDIVGSVVCSNCGGIREDNRIGHTQWCNCCGCFMRGEQKCLTESFGNSDLYPRRNW